MALKQALISVSNKENIAEFSQQLVSLGTKILSTGGTHKLLGDNQIASTDITSYTGFPEIMDGRVKSLHPKIYGGILARGELDQDIMAAHAIESVDIVVVNFYPFTRTIKNPNTNLAQAIEKIDIGGPSLVRAAAKNYSNTIVLTDPSDYGQLIDRLKARGEIDNDFRLFLAQKAFTLVAAYDISIANYLNQLTDKNTVPDNLLLHLHKQRELNYGENPHQQAAVYTNTTNTTAAVNICHAQQLNGLELSFNNINDAQTAYNCVTQLAANACVIVKHAVPCGVACAATSLQAYQNAYATNPTASFGGIIAFNNELDEPTATFILKNQFVEIIIAPRVTSTALKVIVTKPKIKLLIFSDPIIIDNQLSITNLDASTYLVQEHDKVEEVENSRCVTTKQASSTELQDLYFAWKIAAAVKSNAIVYAKDLRSLAIGAGQPSRIDSCNIAATKATEMQISLTGSVMASDAFFPFRDGVDLAAAKGVRAIIQPGGSIRDKAVIAAANEHNIAMLFTQVRHFKH